MRPFVTPILVIFSLVHHHGFSQAYEQEADSVFFDVYVESNELIKGQCTILSAAVLVKNSETIGLRFHELNRQVPYMQVTLESYFPFFGNNNRESLKGESVNINGSHYVKYKFIELAVCPDRNVTIPPLPIELLVVEDSSIMTLWSKELKISTSSSGTSFSTEDSKFQLVGHFDSQTSDYEIQSTTGDTTNLAFEVWGEGNLLPLSLPKVENEGFKMTPYVQTFHDTIINYSYWNRKSFNIEIISKKQGSYDLSRLLEVPFYSLLDNDEKKLSLDVSMEITGETVVSEEIIDDLNLVLLLDISQSMDIEDYYFNRLDRASTIINSFLENRCYPLYTISGDASRHKSCKISRQVVSKRTRGTSIGNGLWFAIEYLKGVNKKQRGIVLISDGDRTSGNVSFSTVTELANRNGVKIYTVGVGTHGKAPYGTDFFGRPRYIENTFDDKSLKDISEATGGKYYHLPVNSDGNEIVNEIMSLLN